MTRKAQMGPSFVPQIEDGHKPEKTRDKYGIAKLKKGQSFTVGPELMQRVRNAAYAYARRMNLANADNPDWEPIVFTCQRDRKQPHLWRIFRTE